MNLPFIDTRILRRLWTISWPTIIYSLLETCVGLTDIYFAGFLGSDAVASIGFSRQVFLAFMIGTLSITTGTITLIAQYYGAGRYDMASLVAGHSLYLAIGSGLVLGLGGVLLSRHALLLLGATKEVMQHGIPYLHILMGGVVFLMINFTVNAVFRALGDTKTPLKITSVIIVLNIGMNYIFVFGLGIVPAMGVKGIALGTIVARMIGAIWALLVLSDGGRKVFINWTPVMHFDLIQRMLNIGFPSGISGFFRNGARILFFRIIATTSAGTAAVAAATVGFQVRMMTIMPALAIQVGTSALVGQSIGANNIKEAEGVGWTSLKMCLLIFGLLGLILFLFPVWIVKFFNDVPEVVGLAKLTIRFIAIEQFCNCVSIVVSGALSGAGDTRPAMRYTILSQWLLMLPVAFLLSQATQYDIGGAWLAWGIAPIVQTVLTVFRFMEGRWKEIKPTEL